MVKIAQEKRIVREFELGGKFYAFDSTTIDLCLKVFWWARFRKHKAGIKLHTLYDVKTQIPTFFHITEVKVHDMNAIDVIPYGTEAYFIFDRRYFDLKRLYKIHTLDAYFVIREKSRLNYEAVFENIISHENTSILSDQIIKLTGYVTSKKYPSTIRRVVYYASDLNKTFSKNTPTHRQTQNADFHQTILCREHSAMPCQTPASLPHSSPHQAAGEQS